MFFKSLIKRENGKAYVLSIRDIKESMKSLPGGSFA